MKWNPFRGNRHTRLGVRIAAVAVLVIGLGAGVVIGLHQHSADTLSVSVNDAAHTERAAANTLSTDTDRPQARPVGGALEQARQDSNTTQQAKDKASEKAKAANEAASNTAAKAAQKRMDARADASGSSSSAESGEEAPATPVDCQSYSGNRQVGCSLLPSAGFGTDQMSCLDKLWTRESGWNVHASNAAAAPTASPKRCQPAKWPHTVTTTATTPYRRSSGAWTTSRAGTARPAVHGPTPKPPTGTKRTYVGVGIAMPHLGQ